jgi:hypothetical protein
MVEEVSIAGLRAKQRAKRSRIMAIVQSLAILLLLVAMAEEYNHNQFFQAWAGTHLGSLSFLLNGTLATFYAGVLVAVLFRNPSTNRATLRVGDPEPVVVIPETR